VGMRTARLLPPSQPSPHRGEGVFTYLCQTLVGEAIGGRPSTIEREGIVELCSLLKNLLGSLISAMSSARVLPDERADALDRLLSLRQERSKELPDVDHVVPDLQGHLHPSRLGAIGDAGGVIE
jgi:hypothetical protein